MRALLFAFRNVLRNRRRSITTILVAAIGCAALLISGGFALYTYRMLADNAARESGHITIADKRFFEEEEETPMQFGIERPSGMTAILERDNRIEFVLPRLSFSGLVSNGGKAVIFSGMGANIKREISVRGDFLKIEAGEINPGKDISAMPAVTIGKDLARTLKAQVGSQLTLMATTANGGMNSIAVVVAAIVTTGWDEADKRLILIDIEPLQRLLVTDKVSSLSIYLRDAQNVQTMLEEFLALDSNNLTPRSWSEQAFYYASVKALYNRIFGLLGVIILLLVLFSVSNTLATSVAERTREIGTFRALGSYPQEIMAHFVHEGAVIGMVGALIGNAMAWVTAFLLPYIGWEMPPPPGRSIGYPLLVSTPALLYVAVNVLIVLLCCTAAWFASKKATKMPIMEALRHV